LHEAEGIELTRVPLIGKHTEMPPVDFESFAGGGFHAYLSSWSLARHAYALQILLQNAQTAVETQRPELLRDDHGTGFGILLQQFADDGFKRIQFAGTLAPRGRARGSGQVLSNGSASNVEMTRDFTYRPLLGEVQAMNGVDLFWDQHSDTWYMRSSSRRT